MKRKRVVNDIQELEEVVNKLQRLDTSLKRKHEEPIFETNKRVKKEGIFHYTINEYKKAIISLYKQNKRLLERVKESEEAFNNLTQEIKKRGLESRNWQRPCSPKNIPTVVM